MKKEETKMLYSEKIKGFTAAHETVYTMSNNHGDIVIEAPPATSGTKVR